MSDSIDRQAAIDAIHCDITVTGRQNAELVAATIGAFADRIKALPSAQPEQPHYVAEIEAEYQKAVKMPHIHKPLAKALYEVWKKHDREDAERREE